MLGVSIPALHYGIKLQRKRKRLRHSHEILFAMHLYSPIYYCIILAPPLLVILELTMFFRFPEGCLIVIQYLEEVKDLKIQQQIQIQIPLNLEGMEQVIRQVNCE